MKTYTISDLHGYPVDKFKALLDKANFSDTDTLYRLGDGIDRDGDGGVSLLRYIMAQPNFGFILGNHEDMLLKSRLIIEERTEAGKALGIEYFESLSEYSCWMLNGGGVTLEHLRDLSEEDPGAVKEVFDYLNNSPHIAALTVNGRDFLRPHAHAVFKRRAPRQGDKDAHVDRYRCRLLTRLSARIAAAGRS